MKISKNVSEKYQWQSFYVNFSSPKSVMLIQRTSLWVVSWLFSGISEHLCHKTPAGECFFEFLMKMHVFLVHCDILFDRSYEKCEIKNLSQKKQEDTVLTIMISCIL